MNDESHYKYITDRLDIDNMLEYFVFQMYIANTDWPGANNKVWRKRDNTNPSVPYEDGKYRYVLYDTDCGMNKYGDFRFNNAHPTMFHWVFENNYKLYKDISIRSLDVAKSIITNKGFKAAFINKFCDRVNVDYSPEVFMKKLDPIVKALEPEIQDDLIRYNYLGGNTEEWYRLLQTYRNYVYNRHEVVIGELAEYFNRDIAYLTIFHSENGFVDINGNIQVGMDGDFKGRYVSDNLVVLTAMADEGYRFVRWSDGNTDKSRHIEFDGDMLEMRLKAIFEKVQ